MGAIAQLAERRYTAQARDPSDDFWYQPVGAISQAGVRVSPETAMRIATVYACVKVLAEDLSSVPLITYERAADDGRTRATEHPLYDVLHDEPNDWQTSMEWREMKMGHALLRGNAYSRIVPGDRGFVDQLVPLHPQRVTPEPLPGNRLRYRVLQDDGREEILLRDEVFHLRGLSDNGITGISIVEYGVETFGLTASAQAYASRFFSQNASPPGVLQHPSKLSDTALRHLRSSWAERHAGPSNWHRPAILEEGLTWQSIGMSAGDAQLLESRAKQDIDCTKWFRMQPHKVGILDRATYSNIEHQSLEHVTDTIRPWAVRWEQRIHKDLIIARRRFFVEHLLDALVRGDIKARYEAYSRAILTGWMNRNEARRKENMNAAEGLDDFLEPQNMRDADEPAPGDGRRNNNARDEQDVRAQAEWLAREAAARVVRRETAALQRAAQKHADDSDAWKREVEAFYEGHAPFVAEALNIGPAFARNYVERQRAEAVMQGMSAIERWEVERPVLLARLALGDLNVWR